MSAETQATPRRMRRLEPAAIAGVMSREVANFRTYWKGTTFSSVLEPLVYLLAFGLGLGATLVDEVEGVPYIQFVGTGMVATAVIFSSALPAMFGTFVKHRFQNTYEAILAAPVDVEELVSAEMLWIAARSAVYGCVPLLVTFFWGLDPAPGMLLVPIFCLRHRARLRRLRGGDGGDRGQDRPVQLRDRALRHAALPRRRHLLPDLRACPRASSSSPRSTPCTSWSNWSAAAPSATRRSTSPASPSSSPSPSLTWRVAISRMSKRLID